MDQITDSEMDQQQRQGHHHHHHSEPCILAREATNISRPNNNHAIVRDSGNNATNVVDSYFPQYNNGSIHPSHNNLDMAVPVTANLYYSGMNPSSSSSTGVFHPPLINHQRASSQLSGSSTFAITGGGSSNNFGSSSFMDDARGPYKRKNPEGIRGNFQDFNAAASSSSSISAPNARQADGTVVAAMMDTTPFPIPSLVEVGPHGSAWNRAGESIMVHDHNNHLIHGNYLGQHFQPFAPPWLFQQLNSNNNDAHTTPWNQSLPMPCVQAPAINRSSLESVSMGLQRYHHDPTAGNRNGFRFPHHIPVNQQQHHNNYHHSPTLPAMQGVREQHNNININFHPSAAITTNSFRVPTNPLRSVAIPTTPTGFEMGPRHVGPAPSAGLRIYRPHRGFVPETTLRHRSLAPAGFLQVDDVALIDEVGNLVDHHRDMRLDIEDMSYEDLLALGERIGNVNTGLTEETIITQLKTKTYLTPATDINLEEEACDDQEAESCIICQDEFKNQEKIGVIQCEHEYHADCLRKWLVVKNACPICKSEALTL